MKKRITATIAALAIIGVTTGIVLAQYGDDPTGSGMPVPGSGVEDVIVTDPTAGMPVPGADAVDETVVEGDSAGSGMLVPGFEGQVEDTVVEGGSASSGMLVPGFEGQVQDTVVSFD